MKLGLVFPQAEIPDDPIVIRDYVQAVEALGFDYLLAYDHVVGVNPAKRPDWNPFGVANSAGGRDNNAHAKQKLAPYDSASCFQEPMVLHAYLAGLTTKIEFATGVLILPQRQTALVAKQAANLSNLSGGRFRLGVGIGWNDAEYEAMGQDFKKRGRRIEEQLPYLRRLWSEDTVTFSGDFDEIRGAGIKPKPKQPIPLWVGGNSDIAMSRAARLADGWQPTIVLSATEAAEKVDKFRSLVENAGRDPAQVGLENLIQCGATMGGELQTPESAASAAKAYREAGFSHVCIATVDAGHQSLDDHLDFATRWLQMVR